MATEQQTQTRLPTLAVTISSPIPAAPSTTPIVKFISTPDNTSFPTTAAAPLTPSTSASLTNTASVSTPTSGMHSPPLSNSVEEENVEMNTAAAAKKNPKTVNTTATATPRASSSHTQSTASNNLTQGSRSVKTKGPVPTSTPTPTPAAATTTTTTSSMESNPSGTSFNTESLPATMTLGHPATTSNLVNRVNESLIAVEREKQDLCRPQGKEKTIEHVLQQGRILKVSRRLRTRLEYAILKIRRGWSKYTLQEVESLIQPVCSPRVTASQIHQSISRQSSPRQSERKRVKRVYPDYDVSYFRGRTSDPAGSETEKSENQDVEMSFQPSAPSTPTSRFRARMPSLSQFKDSELFQPAKSLMNIATSKPDPGYLSPYHPSSEHETNVPSAAQAAQTILMLSSPTRPAARTLNPTHSPIADWSTAPYSPSTSSPLVHFHISASRTPSPESTPPAMYDQSAPLYMDNDHSNSQLGSSLYSSRPLKQPYSNLYGMGYEPSSPSPLSTSLFPSSNESMDKPKIHSRSSSPTLKRAVRFAAAATNASESSKLSAENIKEGFSGLSGNRTEYNSTTDSIYPGSQPGYDDKKELSPSLYNSRSPMHHSGEPYLSIYSTNRATTPPLHSIPSSSPSSYSGSYGPTMETPNGSHGMRTPPPSGGKELNLGHYGLESSTSRRRRNSVGVPPGTVDLPSIMFRQGNGAHPPSMSSASPSHR
ncbi:hypothetical protein BX616_001633 [Lobosporangium transversale]|uniref:Uncharacterized protein n=1 Tax=Lobosporangium transversale TaxID=64571 RepID=A0A1Y2GVC3_9FUNG|nr:hypothetical protein BCR41DRAFT_384383 [Lobosporangium transversale]KAF9903432.1 hypothetical protein BX616_001633 [Lobosporangium transversale]ORZ26256.1 hypothetical protein BCR41DRAFT_384383 [Lobosporangium transversale]|eukprot:XP_021884021.1 hypothetical protein BCR41DRAFT_384383 [Lobosporangium transversale]